MQDRPIRTLVLEDDAQDSRLLHMQLLQAAPGQFELTTATRLGDALRLLQEKGFDLILSDLHLPDSSGLMTFRALRSSVPDIPTVVMSTLADDQVALQAVHEGAQDFLVKGQVNGAIVARALRHALERCKNSASTENISTAKATRVLAFIGARAGLGTTTLALNVAAALSLSAKRVILLELRSRPGFLSQYLHRWAPPVRSAPNANPACADLNGQELRNRLTSSPTGLRILYGPQKHDAFKEIDPGQARTLIWNLTHMTDHLVILLPPEPARASQVAVERADFTTVVVDRESTGLSSGKRIVNLVQSWGATSSKVGAVVANLVPHACPPRLTLLRLHLGCEIVGVLPPAAKACEFAQAAGLPLVLTDPRQLIAEAITEFAERLASDPVKQARID